MLSNFQLPAVPEIPAIELSSLTTHIDACWCFDVMAGREWTVVEESNQINSLLLSERYRLGSADEDALRLHSFRSDDDISGELYDRHLTPLFHHCPSHHRPRRVLSGHWRIVCQPRDKSATRHQSNAWACNWRGTCQLPVLWCDRHVLFSVAENTDGAIQVILTIPALLIAALLTIILSFGLAGMVNLVGERIMPEHSSLKKTVWGTVLLTFACALPFVGWFLLLPYVAFLGFGAVILGFFQRES